MHPEYVGEEKFIFDLLPKLAKAGALGKTYSINFSESEFELDTYSIDVLNGAIRMAEKREQARRKSQVAGATK
jgi:hypothetical protein